MDKYRETFETWNRIAQLYQEKFMNLELYNETYDYLLNLLSHDIAKVLDVGCGPGNISRYLLLKKPSLKLKGLDVSANMMALYKEHNPTAESAVMDCRQLERLNEPSDAIVCGFIIPYLSKEDTEKLILASGKLLNDSGLLYLSFVTGDYENSGFIIGSSGDRVYFYYYTSDFIERILEQAHFKILKTFDVAYEKENSSTDIHRILIAKRSL